MSAHFDEANKALDEVEISIRAAQAINEAIAEWNNGHGFVLNREQFIFAFSKGAAFGVAESKRIDDEAHAEQIKAIRDETMAAIRKLG